MPQKQFNAFPQIKATPAPGLAPHLQSSQTPPPQPGGPQSGVCQRFWIWLKSAIVTEVPAASALCEFDCPKTQCTAEEWATCPRRLGGARGELWPEVEMQPSRQRRSS